MHATICGVSQTAMSIARKTIHHSKSVHRINCRFSIVSRLKHHSYIRDSWSSIDPKGLWWVMTRHSHSKITLTVRMIICVFLSKPPSPGSACLRSTRKIAALASMLACNVSARWQLRDREIDDISLYILQDIVQKYYIPRPYGVISEQKMRVISCLDRDRLKMREQRT